jgi:hypothetical protein
MCLFDRGKAPIDIAKLRGCFGLGEGVIEDRTVDLAAQIAAIASNILLIDHRSLPATSIVTIGSG